MSRRAAIAQHLGVAALKQRFRSATDPAEARRWQLLWLVAAGRTIGEAASVVDLSARQGGRIVARSNRFGPEGVVDRRTLPETPRKPPLLDEQAQAALASALRGPAPDGGAWTGRKVAAWMERATGRSPIAPQRGWDYLRKLGPPEPSVA